jgi:hypothetical protein
MIVHTIGKKTGPFGYVVQAGRAALLVDPFALDDAMTLLSKKRIRPAVVVFTRSGKVASARPAGSIDCPVFAPAPIDGAPFAQAASRDGSFAFGGRRWRIVGAGKSSHRMVGNAQAKLLFSGDVLLGFGAGCGFLRDEPQARVAEMLGGLRSLSESTRIYGAFDFGDAHARYCEVLRAPEHPSWRDLYREERAALRKQRAAGDACYPTLLGYERAFNPFLTTKSKTAIAALTRNWLRRFDKPSNRGKRTGP